MKEMLKQFNKFSSAFFKMFNVSEHLGIPGALYQVKVKTDRCN